MRGREHALGASALLFTRKISLWTTGYLKLDETAMLTSQRSSGLSAAFQKPNNLHYRNLMDAQGEYLLHSEGARALFLPSCELRVLETDPQIVKAELTQ